MPANLYHRLAKNVGQLLSANVLSTAINLVALAIVARSLGPAGLGALAMIEAYGRAVDRLVRFEPWQALVRYGIAAIESGRTDDFKRLLKFCVIFDILGALLAASVALAGVLLGAQLLGVSGETARLAAAFAASLAFSISSSSVAVLRIYNRFSLIAGSTVVLAISRVALTAAAWVLSAELWAFVAVLVAHQVLTHLLLFALSLRELASRKLINFWRAPAAGVRRDHPGILRFIVNTNLNVMARQSTERFDVLIVGALVGVSEAGLYQLARRIGNAARKFDGPLRQCLYPDVARLWANGEVVRLRRVVLGVNGAVAVAGVVGLGVMFPFLPQLVAFAFGAEFAAAAPIVLLQMLAVVIALAGSTLNPALLSIGADGPLLRISIATTICFFAVLVPATLAYGVAWAAVAHVVSVSLWLVFALYVFLARTGAAVRSAAPVPAGA